MSILNEYMNYIQEENEDKPSWKERLKKYGKYALSAAALGAAAYAGKKYSDHKTNNPSPIKIAADKKKNIKLARKPEDSNTTKITSDKPKRIINTTPAFKDINNVANAVKKSPSYEKSPSSKVTTDSSGKRFYGDDSGVKAAKQWKEKEDETKSKRPIGPKEDIKRPNNKYYKAANEYNKKKAIEKKYKEGAKNAADFVRKASQTGPEQRKAAVPFS